ncbi:hypothetical protein, variant [Aphanomyces invadans]|uniref:JmjC domain-containing protein n=1 Tax=Aphanomyces invadans TaxID=157072 RepID=A0A024TE84_9STRA|nr:hypothetical protein, variant [Aphanomyces invadans]ETV91667.1 hypothetical protein, variant [Aphanomyces invadans]|eukprot:XP_008879593.1 hypothetical protein, variant [Aphanomyces invadans]
MQKRKREDDSGGATFGGSRFSFNFSGGSDKSTSETELAATVLSHPTSASIKQQCAIGESTVSAGTLVTIDWARSSWLQLFVRVAGDDTRGIEGHVHAQFVSLPLHGQPNKPTFTSKDTTWSFDSVFDSAFAGCKLPLHFSTSPLVIEPNLQSLVWPLHLSTFQREVYNQKALVVHGSTHRLQTLQEDLHGFNVSELIQNASRTIAWLKQASPPHRMQYLDVSSPDIAAACYASGHSLYFNPSPEVQERYIRAICSDLGLNFTSGLLDGGIGGDIELFAVQSKHHTPWHFDAQHNFTVQLVGTKEWSYAKGPLTDPMSNLHLSSSNTASVVDDMLAHAMSGATDLKPPTTEIETVTLRPGSVLYLPAGYWHSVTSFDEGSLSMNFSIDGARWMDVAWNRLMPALAVQPAWRERPNFCHGPENARAQWKARLTALAKTVQAMADAVDVVLPDALFHEPDGESGGDEAAPLTLDASDGTEVSTTSSRSM